MSMIDETNEPEPLVRKLYINFASNLMLSGIEIDQKVAEVLYSIYGNESNDGKSDLELDQLEQMMA